MAWKALDRINPAPDDSDVPLLDEATREKIRSFFPRYPTRLAVLLPALHVVQDRYGYISNRIYLGHLQNRPEHLLEAVRLLNDLKSAWAAIPDNRRPAVNHPNPQTMPAKG